MFLLRRRRTGSANHGHHKSTGQALVETALLLPILLILLVAAIDLGRAFFGWVNLHQAARIGANYAAMNPQDDYTNPDNDYFDLLSREAAGINCDLDTDNDGTVDADDLPAPTFVNMTGTADPHELGDSATLQLQCGFELITPIAAQIVGNTITMAAESIFPVRGGCIDCPPPASPPGPPQPENVCRPVPLMANMSLEGAMNAWIAAGFLAENFSAPAEPATSTVNAADVTDSDELACEGTAEASYSSTVTVTLKTPDTVVPPCATLPNVVGMTLGDARAAWVAAGFPEDALLPPPDPGDNLNVRVEAELVDAPAGATPGVTCVLPDDAQVTLELGDIWETPPPPPCVVPRFIDEVKKNDAQAIWMQAHFLTEVKFEGGPSNWTVRGQSLVAEEEYHCSVAITVYEVAQEPTP